MLAKGSCPRRSQVLFAVLLALIAPSMLHKYKGKSPLAMTITRVSVLAGDAVELPCDLRPPADRDQLLLVVWYKEGEPVCSYDTRVSDSSALWIREEFVGRMSWHSAPTAGFKVQETRAEDRGTYMCRVDFHSSQTRNYKITLEVIELPGVPLILDEHDKSIRLKAGPYFEGGHFTLNCIVKGGYPPPRIQWLKGNMTLKSSKSNGEKSQVITSLPLEMFNLTREDHASNYTCSADNTVLALPRRASVTIQMYLRPVRVKIDTLEVPFSVGRTSRVLCATTGARPSATISWWLGGNSMSGMPLTEVSQEIGETRSLLQWTPSKANHGQELICRAHNPMLNFPPIESKTTLDVHYAPEVVIQFVNSMNPDNIEEGDDVNFHCKVDANPPPYKIIWEHNGSRLQRPESNIITTDNGRSLTLRNVSRQHAGLYRCVVSNVEGDRESSHLNVRVIYSPTCRRAIAEVIGAPLHEATTVVCEVDAFPPPKVFEWTLNNSAESIILDSSYFTVEAVEGRSIMTYTPAFDDDYGTLECRATNRAGTQVSPCAYRLTPATEPSQPTNCSVYNLTFDSLDLLCEPVVEGRWCVAVAVAGADDDENRYWLEYNRGVAAPPPNGDEKCFDGGLQCIYVAEVWDNKGLVVNSSNEIPLWNLRRLGANKRLRLVVYSFNARGRSEYLVISVNTTQKILPKLESYDARQWAVGWAVGVLVTVALIIAIILCLAFIVTTVRHRSRDYEVNLLTLKNSRVILPKQNPLGNVEEKSPGLEPLNNGMKNDTPKYSHYVESSTARLKTSGFTDSLPRTLTPLAVAFSHYYDLQSEAGRAAPRRVVVTTNTPLTCPLRESIV